MERSFCESRTGGNSLLNYECVGAIPGEGGGMRICGSLLISEMGLRL